MPSRTLTLLKGEAKARFLGGPAPKSSSRFLTVMTKHEYIGKFEIIDDHRAGKTAVNLTGKLNKCGMTSPRLV